MSEAPVYKNVTCRGSYVFNSACGHCERCDDERERMEVASEQPAKPSMTQEECENWIMLKGQTGDAVFEIHLVDKEVDQDPTMRALMETITDMIHQGIMGMPFEESQQAGKPDLEVVKP